MSRAAVENALATWVLGACGYASDNVLWSQQGAPAKPGPYVTMRLSVGQQLGQDWVETADNPLVVADMAIASVSAVANTLTKTAHGLLTGDGPVRLTTTGTLPGGLALLTDYWVIKVDANTFKLAASFLDAIAAVPTPIDLTDAGTGTHTLSDTPTTVRAGAEITKTVRGQRRATFTIQAFSDGDPAKATGDTSPAGVLDTVQTRARLDSVREALAAAGVGILSFGPVQSVDGIIGATEFEPRAVMTVALQLAAIEVSENAGFIGTVQIEGLDPDDAVIVPEFEVEV